MRSFHALTAAVTWGAVILQLALVVQGHNVLDEHNRPDLSTRLVRFFSYLTIWANLLVAWSATSLAVAPQRDGRVWRALRADAVVIIALVGVVHFILLRPLLELDGADLVADKLLHMVVPIVAVVGWLRFGPRGRIRRADLGAFLVLPLAWLAYTLVRGAVVDWYPYPFIDVNKHGYPIVLLNCVGVAALALAMFAGAVALDRRLSGVTDE